MVKLKTTIRSQIYFHLSYGSNVLQADIDALELAMDTVFDSYWESKIIRRVDRCSVAYDLTSINNLPTSLRTTTIGDINRTTSTFDVNDLKIFRENYFWECRQLAQILAVPNYREDVSTMYQTAKLAGSYVLPATGPKDINTGSLMYLHYYQVG
jgi:hypothetical protein